MSVSNSSSSQPAGPCSNSAVCSIIQGSNFYLDRRYNIIDTIGSGAYGVVVSARDMLTGENLAIKKIEKAFEHAVYTKRTLRELKILRLLNNENVMRIKTIQLPSSKFDFNEIYLVSELMETDLSTVIKSPQPLSNEHCQFFLYQLLRGLKYIHGAGILHRDLKPRNLLVNSNCDLKICDFGLARANIPFQIMHAHKMTDYVATRWYRAPEVLLSSKNYTTAMDMWSVGCIFGELLIRKPVLPGTEVNHQLDLITTLIGSPTEDDINAISNKKAREKLAKLTKKKGKKLEFVFNGCDPMALDLLKKMLVFNPDKRLTAEQALEHPYLASMHVRRDEPNGQVVSLFDFEFEMRELTMDELKDMIYEEILLYHSQEKKNDYERAKIEFENRLKTPLRRLSKDKDELKRIIRSC